MREAGHLSLCVYVRSDIEYNTTKRIYANSGSLKESEFFILYLLKFCEDITIINLWKHKQSSLKIADKKIS